MLNCGSSSQRGDTVPVGLAVSRGQWFSYIRLSRIYWHADLERDVCYRHTSQVVVLRNGLCRKIGGFSVWYAVDSNQQAAVLGRRIVTGTCGIADEVTSFETGPVAFGQISFENQEFFLS